MCPRVTPSVCVRVCANVTRERKRTRSRTNILDREWSGFEWSVSAESFPPSYVRERPTPHPPHPLSLSTSFYRVYFNTPCVFYQLRIPARQMRHTVARSFGAKIAAMSLNIERPTLLRRVVYRSLTRASDQVCFREISDFNGREHKL